MPSSNRFTRSQVNGALCAEKREQLHEYFSSYMRAHYEDMYAADAKPILVFDLLGDFFRSSDVQNILTVSICDETKVVMMEDALRLFHLSSCGTYVIGLQPTKPPPLEIFIESARFDEIFAQLGRVRFPGSASSVRKYGRSAIVLLRFDPSSYLYYIAFRRADDEFSLDGFTFQMQADGQIVHCRSSCGPCSSKRFSTNLLI
jgi:hypothetical protein